LNRIEAATGAVVEALEGRRLMTVSMDGSVLVVTAGEGEQVEVGVYAATVSPETGLWGDFYVGVKTNGEWEFVDATEMTGVRLEKAGGDVTFVNNWDDQVGPDLGVTIVGGAGEDTVTGGASGGTEDVVVTAPAAEAAVVSKTERSLWAEGDGSEVWG
jgi:hypothetical protein